MKLAAVVLVFLFCTAAATAKDFRPGDLRLCSGTHCVPIHNQAALDALARFYYGSPKPQPTAAPTRGRRYQLRFTNGYVTGVVAGAHTDRFKSGGVNLEQFAWNRWYRVPPVAAAELRRLALSLRSM